MSFPGESSICQNCRIAFKCFVREISELIYYYDEYTRWCPKCGCMEKRRVEKGSTYLGAKETRCPFCGKRSKDHERTPKELLQNPATS